MRWLQWSTIDLKNGLGGVEVHARSLARELEKKGIEVGFSSDPADLTDFGTRRWDVIQTHGSAPAPSFQSRAIRVHTLHGTTLGRMAACGEWTWPGGYFAALRELRGVKSADVVLSVHPDVWLYSYAKKLGKAHAVCWNGWDSASDQSGVDRALPADIQAQLNELKKYWVYVGRGGDRVKAVDRLQGAMRLVPDLNWVAAPGDGFETSPRVLKTGSLNNAQVRELMTRASGLALCSRYEGNPLVVLEALALGTPVVATRVGAIPSLSEDIQGLVTAEGNPYSLADSIRAAGKFDPSGRQARAEANQKLLPTWEKVAAISLQAVQDLLSSRGAARV